MFGIGYQEMFIVLVVALVIFGPSRLPELAGQVGRWVRDFRRMSADLTGEFEKTFAEVDEVKKSFTREMKSIQNEVEGVGKSARGDLKKSSSKSTAAGKKTTGGALKAGSGAGASGTAGAKPSAEASATANAASPATAGLMRGAAAKAFPVATKADPLADVSFYSLDEERVVAGNGAVPSGNGMANLDADDALSRVRRRRASAAYGQRHSA